MTKGAMKKDDWERFSRGDGGAIVIYPVKKGGELKGMIRVQMVADQELTVAAGYQARRSVVKTKVP